MTLEVEEKSIIDKDKEIFENVLSYKLSTMVTPTRKRMLLLWVNSDEQEDIKQYLENFKFGTGVRTDVLDESEAELVQDNILKAQSLCSETCLLIVNNKLPIIDEKLRNYTVIKY